MNNQGAPLFCDGYCVVTDTTIQFLPTNYPMTVSVVGGKFAIRYVCTGKVRYEGYVIDAQLPGDGVALAVMLDCANRKVPFAIVIDRSRNDLDRIERLVCLRAYGALVHFTHPGKRPQETLLNAVGRLDLDIRRQARKATTDTVQGH